MSHPSKPFDQWTLEEKLKVAAENIELARNTGVVGYLAGWEHLVIKEILSTGVIVPLATEICRLGEKHDEQAIDVGISSSGWARGERTHILRCRKCGNMKGPFITNSGEAGY